MGEEEGEEEFGNKEMENKKERGRIRKERRNRDGEEEERGGIRKERLGEEEEIEIGKRKWRERDFGKNN